MTTAAQVKLLTLLNVSAIKRPRDLDVPGGFKSPLAISPAGSRRQSPTASSSKGANGSEEPTPKRRRSVVFGGEVGPSGSTYGQKKTKAAKVAVSLGEASDIVAEKVEAEEEEEEEEVEAEVDSDTEDEDTFITHFGAETRVLSDAVVAAAEEGKWETSRAAVPGLGRVVEQRPPSTSRADGKARLVPLISSAMKAAPPLANTFLSHLGTYTDLYAHSFDGAADGSESAPFASASTSALRSAASAHMINHVLKTRRRIVRGNEKLAAAAHEGKEIAPPLDQSFTRPKVLLLLPTRSLALQWLGEHIFPLAKDMQIENRRPFLASFGLPEGVEDPLESGKGGFPPDHVENFKGNSDDNFRFGVKITRKAWRVVMPPANEEKLLDCDIIVASPLALKMAAERERSTDILASIEIMVLDGADVMGMQNWDHVNFVFKNLNKLPDQPHGCDFSRLKPWYVDQRARYLRQTLLIGRYDMPEARGIFHHQCFNVAGKHRVDAAPGLKGVLERVRPGVRQVFERFDEERGLGVEAGVEEVDKRFESFTKKTLPSLLRAAGSRTQTIVVVPSYFDFVRVTNHLRKTGVVTYAALSEYSSNAEISRARTQFFKQKKAFLIVTERFHFYRRYRLRGARTVVFYSLPDHAAFYAEFLAMPFVAGQGAETEVDEAVDAADVRAVTLFSRFDVLRLERVVGHADARKMLASGESRFEFV